MSKKEILAKIKTLLANNPLLDHATYVNKHGKDAYSIFGFEATTTAQLPQEAKDVISAIRSTGKNATYTYDNSKGEGSIYVGPKSSKAITDDSILNVL